MFNDDLRPLNGKRPDSAEIKIHILLIARVVKNQRIQTSTRAVIGAFRTVAGYAEAEASIEPVGIDLASAFTSPR